MRCRPPPCLVLAIVLTGAAFVASPVRADTTILKQEPGPGFLHPGQQVLVDDHSCPAGQIKLVTGGSNTSIKDGHRVLGKRREAHCIPH